MQKKYIHNFTQGIPICWGKVKTENDMKIEYCLSLGSDYLNRKSATFFISSNY